MTFSFKTRMTATFAAAILLILVSCTKSDDKNGNTAEKPAEQALKAKVQYGKIKEVQLTATIDNDLAHKGGKVFDVTCTGCHKYDERYVGPALREVTKRRQPEFIMNMILDTETMIEKDDTVKCLLQTYLQKMPNMQVDEKDARAVLEHLRDIADKK